MSGSNVNLTDVCVKDIEGIVNLKLINKDTGEVIEDRTSNNTVLTIGKAMMVKLLAGLASYKITKMSIGNGGTADLTTNAFNPIPPSVTDKGCLKRVYTASISSSSVNIESASPTVTFVALFDCLVINNKVNECCLVFNDSATAFSRYTFSTVDLNNQSGFALQITWTLKFK